MNTTPGWLNRWAASLRRATLQELDGLFGPLVSLPHDFGGGIRTRLFSPLKNLLALSFPGPRRKGLLP